MRVYNYSDKPVVINGVPINTHIIHLDTAISPGNVLHNGTTFLPNHDQDRNSVFTIMNTGTGYAYREDVYSNPPVWWFSSILIVSIGYLMLIKVMQKIRARI